MLSGSESNVGAVVAILVAQGFVCGSLSGTIAGAKGHEGGTWFFAGFLFGPLGLIAAAGLPTKASREFFLTRKCPACAEAVRIESKRCKHCGEPAAAKDTDDAISASIMQDHQHRVAAMEVLKTLPRDAQELHLIAILNSAGPNADLATEAARRLIDLAAPAGLIAVFRSGHMTAQAVEKLTGLHDPALFPIFRSALSNEYLRDHAIEGLASFGRDAFTRLLEDPDLTRPQRRAIEKRVKRF